jgi:hypothetical protein
MSNRSYHARPNASSSVRGGRPRCPLLCSPTPQAKLGSRRGGRATKQIAGVEIFNMNLPRAGQIKGSLPAKAMCNGMSPPSLDLVTKRESSEDSVNGCRRHPSTDCHHLPTIGPSRYRTIKPFEFILATQEHPGGHTQSPRTFQNRAALEPPPEDGPAFMASLNSRRTCSSRFRAWLSS